MIVGYGAVFDRNSSDMGFIESIDSGAFNRTINAADVRGLANHDPNWLLGRTKAGTMRLRTDANGLYYEIDVNTADPDGQRALAKVQRGDWDGSSFSFTTIRDEWNWEATPPERRLLEVSLIDVGPVTYPAYPDATATSRALEPVAEKLGRPVNDLVAALASGEIRSLIGGTMRETVEAPDAPEPEAPESESSEPEGRAGKAISAANLAKIQAAYDQLRDLMDTALGESPADSDVTEPVLLNEPNDGDEQDGRHLSLVEAGLEVRRRVASLDAA